MRALQLELILEPLAGRWNVGEPEFASLIELPFDCKLRPLDLHSQIGRTLRQLAEQSKADRGNQVLQRRRTFAHPASFRRLIARNRVTTGDLGFLVVILN